MIPCPYCERGFEKRAGLMRHVTASHHSEGVVPVNPGGAIEPVVPVETEEEWLARRPPADGGPDFDGWLANRPDPETWAEGLTDEQLTPGQERYVDPPVELANGTFIDDVLTLPEPYPHAYQDVKIVNLGSPIAPATPTSEQYTRIRALRRQGRPETEAWMTVVGYPPPQRETPTEDSRPLRLQQVAFRVREGNTDHIDATWLLRLAEIGRDAVAHIGEVEDHTSISQSIVDRWNETIA